MYQNNYRISDRYSEQEQIDFLRKRGFNVKKVKESFSKNVYHNDVECWEADVWGVFDKAGNSCYKFAPEYWLKDAFEKELYKKFLE